MKKFITILFFGLQTASAQHLLYIPDTLSGTSFDLTVHRDSVQFKPGTITQTLGINSHRYLGPTLLMRKGDSVQLAVHNHIGDTTTMHWHGLHVAPQNDGGPMSLIMDGLSWNPGFVVRNNAATYWYHPHIMAKTAAQAIKGDAGFIIVRDSMESTLTLPRTYGTDDIPIVVQSVELDSNNQFMPKGMVDSVVLVNGTDSPYVRMPAQVVRLRLLNGSGERTFNFGLKGNKTFYVIGNDGGLLQAPVTTTRIRLSPGERAEILADFGGMNGDTTYLMSYASELPIGVQGGPTMPMPPGSPLMNSPLNGIDFNILQILITAPTASPIYTVPATLVADTAYPASAANAYRTISMTADSALVMDGPFYFNGLSFDMSRIDYHIPLNNVEIWTLTDSTMVGHPFHIHDVHFYILDRNGVPPSDVEKGRKDVVLIAPYETVRFITKFNDFADTSIPYMFHCHILMHEDDGMMGQFVVGPFTDHTANLDPQPGIKLFPNPAHSELNISADAYHQNETVSVRVVNTTGQLNWEGYFSGSKTVSTSTWQPGIYLIYLTTTTGSSVTRILIQ